MEIQLNKAADGVWILRLNRPHQLNALTDSTVEQFRRALDKVAMADECRVLVLTGNGRGFCTGFDLTLAGDAPDSGKGETQAWMKRQEAFAKLVTRLRELRQPVIAAINGPATGAGMGLALACDMRMASHSASFNSAFIKVGMSSCDIGVSYLLPRCVGTAHAFDIMLSARVVDADEALRIGLVSRICASQALLSEALTLGREIAKHDGFAVWMTKRGMWANLEAGSLQAALELENRTQILSRTTGELAAAARRFTEKAKPKRG